MNTHTEAPRLVSAPEAAVVPVTSAPVTMELGGLVFRPAMGTHGRAALEVLTGGEELLGVYVDTSLGTVLLGGLRGRRDGQPWAVAWGRLPPQGARTAVAFDGGQLRRRSRPVSATIVGDRFWVAEVTGEFRTVTAVCDDVVESRRLVPHHDGH